MAKITYEYTAISVPTPPNAHITYLIRWLNRYADEGWEFLSHEQNVVIFRREKEITPSSGTVKS